ncbi:bacillithiol biosynthesis cysteine-adding enzyme BshC [Pollutibacter soli]|uniref:bacillithiol biosynthesis cysteine-adding enzyme BshC n=1 Tax=Pollutibacter soli TaxID=3034157 RepID=UPI003013B70F
MDCTVTQIPYRDTFQFSDLVLDYLDNKPELRTFFEHSVDISGIKNAIRERQQFGTDRKLISEIFREQYSKYTTTELQTVNISFLEKENCFTICTAHQPNIFTGYLYSIYKTAHVIRIAADLSKEFPEFHFVPVFYIGSEDNDLEELGQINVNGVKYRWNTEQRGAVGRMKVDKDLLKIRDEILRQMASYPFGSDLISIIKDAYAEGKTIAEATTILLNHLFGNHGLLVLQPDDARLKAKMVDIFRDDLFKHTANQLLENSNKELGKQYKIQVNPREINLFFLEDDKRDRLTEKGERYCVDGSDREFSTDEIDRLISQEPGKFSPNVVLRGIYQEIILPNILFVGGGSEIAYWLELKPLFKHYHVPYPVIVLRNSFLVLSKEQQHKVNKLGWEISDLFKPDLDLMNGYVKKHSTKKLSLEEEISKLHSLYEQVKSAAGEVDATLLQHVAALEHRAIKELRNLEKKLLRAEKRNYETQQRQLQKIKEELFPKNGLQERVDNFMPWFGMYGQAFIDQVVQCSSAFDQAFGILCLD